MQADRQSSHKQKLERTHAIVAKDCCTAFNNLKSRMDYEIPQCEYALQ